MKQKISIFIILAIDVFGIWLSFGIAIIFKNLLYGDYILLDIGRYQGLISSYLIMVFLLFYQGAYTRRYDFWHESRILAKSCFFTFLLSLFLYNISISLFFLYFSSCFSISLLSNSGFFKYLMIFHV